MTITWLRESPSGLRSTGFISTRGSIPAASACTTCARPISLPSRVTKELSAIFCALKGATRSPSCAKMRQRPVTSVLLPTVEAVPCTISVRARRVTPCTVLSRARMSRRQSSSGRVATRIARGRPNEVQSRTTSPRASKLLDACGGHRPHRRGRYASATARRRSRTSASAAKNASRSAASMASVRVRCARSSMRRDARRLCRRTDIPGWQLSRRCGDSIAGGGDEVAEAQARERKILRQRAEDDDFRHRSAADQLRRGERLGRDEEPPVRFIDDEPRADLPARIGNLRQIDPGRANSGRVVRVAEPDERGPLIAEPGGDLGTSGT